MLREEGNSADLQLPISLSLSMSARQAFNTIARRRLIPPKPQKTYVKWYMNWADKAHKAIVLTCVGVTCTPIPPPSSNRD
jgi:Cytochrome oxidase c assembly